MCEFEKAYERKHPALARAEVRLRSLLREVVSRIEDKRIVRAEFDNVRPKEMTSLKRKAEKAGWTAEQALTNSSDLVGGRVVCNNIEDVYRFAEHLREYLPIDSGPIEIQDYIKSPIKGGYRALHLNFRINVAEAIGFELIPCEVQIRSRLQDAWAELSHPDIYKEENLPDDLRARAESLADLLAHADKTASEIRTRVRQITEPPKDRPNLDQASAGGIAYIFKDVFGRGPPDYAVAQALNLCDQLGIKSLARLPAILSREEFREQLDKEYSAIIGVNSEPETKLLASLQALAKDDIRAIKYVRRLAKRELRESERFARREMLASVPNTLDDLVEELEALPHSEDDILFWAEALGATNNCAICPATIVDPAAFAEGAIHHYDVSDEEADAATERIERAIYRSGVDTGGWRDPTLCSYHDDQMARDD